MTLKCCLWFETALPAWNLTRMHYRGRFSSIPEPRRLWVSFIIFFSNFDIKVCFMWKQNQLPVKPTGLLLIFGNVLCAMSKSMGAWEWVWPSSQTSIPPTSGVGEGGFRLEQGVFPPSHIVAQCRSNSMKRLCKGIKHRGGWRMLNNLYWSYRSVVYY